MKIHQTCDSLGKCFATRKNMNLKKNNLPVDAYYVLVSEGLIGFPLYAQLLKSDVYKANFRL